MSDYQRSLSEGRLVDSDISRDGLSQSHDSVFSESAGTASSLSITLKNELADVLRKRRKDRQGEVSDEDLGLPLSPITPQRKDRGMNKSEGSLSILSMTSSDLDLDERSTSNASGHNLLHLDSSASGHSIGLNRSDNMDESGDSSKLSHSAAKHKLAVRPKKKGPTRARTRPARETSLLPATPEVNEDSLKLSTCNIADVVKHSAEAEEKAHSLPYVGVMPIVMTPAAPVTGSSSSTTELTASSSIYVNKTLSKSHQEFDGAGGATRKDDDGFFKRILNYSFKKKKHEKEETAGSPKREENTSSVYITPSEGTTDPGAGEQLMKLSLVVGDADAGAEEQQKLASGYRKIKSGPAARQRIFPKDIYGSGEEQQHQHHQRYSSNVEVNRQSVASSSGSGHSLLAVAGEGGRGPLHKSEEYLSSAKVRKFSERSVDEGGEGDDEESDGLRKYVSHGEGGRVKSTGAGKVYGQSAYQQKLAKMSVTQQQQQQQQQDSSPSKRKAVEKSKSFRTYTDNVSNNLQQAGGGTSSAGNGTAHGHQLPSLPNLSSSLSVGNFSTNNFLETEHKFFSMTDNMNAGKQRVFKDYISNAGDDGADGRLLLTSSASLQKFEINDNNLLNPREEYYDHQPKSIVLTTNTLTPPEPSNSSILHKSNQNISQIEETIDKLVSSQFVSIIRSSDSDGSSTERLDDVGGHVPEFMKIQLNRVDGASSGRSVPPARTNVVLTSSPTPVPPTSPAIDRSPPTEPVDTVRMRRFSNENIEITESKPPLPPSAARTSLDGGGGVPRSPPAFRKQSSGGGSGDVPGSKRNSMNLSQELSDDRKVILQRRTSVTEEKIKYERRISSSSEDIKYEKRKSTSEEVLEKQPRAGGGPAGGGGVNSSYTSGSSSGDELVVLRKKFVVDREGRREKDSTPELMKVFARRSLKLRSDDDYKVVSTGGGGGGLEGKSMCSIDSDKENQSSEEKLDKVGVAKHHHHHQQQQQEAPASLSGPPSSNGSMTSTSSLGTAKGCPELGNKNGVTTTAAPVSSDPTAGGEPILRKNTTSKPFGVPNRFSNLANGQSGRNATSFIDVRKTLLPPSVPTASANGNNNNNNTGKSATTNNGESGGDGPPSVNNNNNNNNHHNHHHHSASSNRHTIASLNQLNSAGGGGGVVVIANNNLVPTIEAIGGGVGGGGGEINEFKGILQRRAEWEKRAKEGFK